MKTNELIRKLKKAGCWFYSHGGNHDWWQSPITNQKFQVPGHGSQDVGPELKRSIQKQSGVEL